MRKRSIWGEMICHWAGLMVLFNLVGPASAATHEQIVGACREAARPTMVACMQRGQGEGDRAKRHEQCRQAVGIGGSPVLVGARSLTRSRADGLLGAAVAGARSDG